MPATDLERPTVDAAWDAEIGVAHDARLQILGEPIDDGEVGLARPLDKNFPVANAATIPVEAGPPEARLRDELAVEREGIAVGIGRRVGRRIRQRRDSIPGRALSDETGTLIRLARGGTGGEERQRRSEGGAREAIHGRGSLAPQGAAPS
jgi:hypothetical protein